MLLDKRIGALILCLNGAWSAAQTDTLEAHFPELELTARRGETFGRGQYEERFDSAVLTRCISLADLLARHSLLFVKQYGAAGLATLSGRGGTAQQTALVWEGLLIQNPMLGQSDLSLVPAAWLDEVRVQHGGGSGLWGGGAANGAVLLSHQAPYGKGWGMRVGLRTGSWGNFAQDASLHYGATRWALRTRLLFSTAQNDFPFRHPNRPGRPWQRQSNADMEQSGWLQELYALPHSRHSIEGKLWWLRSLRSIPPNLLQTRADDRQSDQALRCTLRWTYRAPRFTGSLRAAYLHERLDYKSAAVDSRSLCRQVVLEGEQGLESGTPEHNVRLGQQYLYAVVSGTAYAQARSGAAFWSAYGWQRGGWSLRAAGRLEWQQGQPLAPAGSLSVERAWASGWSLRLHASRNYRLPTLNDRFWQPGGNPDLRPESSWNAELGTACQADRGKHRWDFQAAAFVQWAEEQIVWLPDGASALWRPQNSGKRLGLGLQWRGHWQWQASKRLHLSVGLSHQFCRSVDAQGYHPLYAPQHQAALDLHLRYGTAELFYTHGVVGRRFITADNSERLPAYQTASVRLAVRLPQPLSLRLYVECDNPAAWQYTVVSQRLMPGRQWTLGLLWVL